MLESVICRGALVEAVVSCCSDSMSGATATVKAPADDGDGVGFNGFVTARLVVSEEHGLNLNPLTLIVKLLHCSDE